MRKPRVLLIHIGELENTGCRMMLQSVMKHVDSRFYYNRLTVCRDYGKLLEGTWRLSGFDLALVLGGDAYTIHYGAWQFLRLTIRLFLMYLLKQRYAFLAQTFCDYGPFTPLVKMVFKHATLITVREELSKSYLDSIGIPSYLTSDLVWSLQPEELPRIKLRRNSFHGRVWASIKGSAFPWPLQLESRNWKYITFKNGRPDVARLREKSLKNFELIEEVLKC